MVNHVDCKIGCFYRLWCLFTLCILLGLDYQDKLASCVVCRFVGGFFTSVSFCIYKRKETSEFSAIQKPERKICLKIFLAENLEKT